MPMKRVLYVTNVSDDVAGKSEFELLLALSRYKDLMLFVLGSIEQECKEAFDQHAIRFFELTPQRKFQPSFIKLARTILRDEKIDVMYLSSHRGVGNGAFAAVGLPVRVISYRGAAGVHWHDPLSYISALHPRIDLICCLSYFVKRKMEEQMKLVKKPCVVIHKGMDDAVFQHVQMTDFSNMGVESEHFTIACAARWKRIKGLEDLIAAMAFVKSPKVKLLLMGAGTDGEEARNLVTRAGLGDKILLLGQRDDVYQVINASKLYIQPSRKEGLGRALIEAMFLEKAIISTRSGGPEELMEDGQSAYFVEVGDHQAMATAIDELVENEALRNRLAQNARMRAINHFSLTAYVHKMHQLLMNTDAFISYNIS
jgi:L-malate glycosyltransferase